MKRPLFLAGSNPLLRLIVFALLSVALIYADLQGHQLDRLRGALNTLIYPLQIAVDFPAHAASWVNEALVNRSRLIEQNSRLRAENLQLSSRLRSLESLKYENEELQRLLKSARAHEYDFILARLLAVSMNRVQQRIIVDKGSRDGVEAGVALLDGLGLMGEITRVYPYHSEATLISDASVSIPVRVARNGLRGIATGIGVSDSLKLLYFPVTADIHEGDTLVTSGLGGRYPPDLPVAVVSQVSTSSNSPFADVIATPLAALNQSRRVLILRPGNTVEKSDSGEAE